MSRNVKIYIQLAYFHSQLCTMRIVIAVRGQTGSSSQLLSGSSGSPLDATSFTASLGYMVDPILMEAHDSRHK